MSPLESTKLERFFCSFSVDLSPMTCVRLFLMHILVLLCVVFSLNIVQVKGSESEV